MPEIHIFKCQYLYNRCTRKSTTFNTLDTFLQTSPPLTLLPPPERLNQGKNAQIFYVRHGGRFGS